MGHHTVTDAGGYLGSPYFKIQIAGTDRTLAATADNELVALPLHRRSRTTLAHRPVDDGTYRILPKSMDKQKEPMVLTAVGASTATLAKFDPKSDKGAGTLRNRRITRSIIGKFRWGKRARSRFPFLFF